MSTEWLEYNAAYVAFVGFVLLMVLMMAAAALYEAWTRRGGRR